MSTNLKTTSGQVAILSVGSGDMKISFDKSNPAERIRAARIVKDLMKRGYALLIEVEIDGQKKFTRALEFDENVCEYVIADFDPITAEEQDQQEDKDGREEVKAGEETGPAKVRRGRPSTKRVDANTTRAVAVARTAGG